MIRKQLLAIVVVGIGVWTATATSQAQDSSSYSTGQRSFSLVDQVEDFGRSIFGSRPKKVVSRHAEASQATTTNLPLRTAERPPQPPQITYPQGTVNASGVSAVDAAAAANTQSNLSVPEFPSATSERDNRNSGAAEPSAAIARPVRRWSSQSGTERPGNSASPAATARTTSDVPSANPSTGRSDGINVPLYERMKGFRQSAFDGNNASSNSDAATAPRVERPTATKTESAPPNNTPPSNPPANAPTTGPAVAPPVSSTPAVASPTPAVTPNPSVEQTPRVVPAEPSTNGYRGAWRTRSDAAGSRPDQGPNERRPLPSTTAAGVAPTRTPSVVPNTVAPVATSAKPPYVGAGTAPNAAPAATPAAIPNTTPAAIPNTTPAPSVTRSATTPASGNLLQARQGPALTSETVGPRRISVGRESSYEVTIQNSADVAAEELILYVDLPAWAEITGAEVSIGTAQAVTGANAARQVQWKLGRLDGKSQQRLVLKLIPRESRPFDLAVRWDYRPMSTQAAIEVQEARLAIRLEGPREVLFGHRDLYKIRVLNSGTGDAENAILKLLPAGTATEAAASHRFGTIGPNEEKSIEVELTSHQAGNLAIKLTVECDGGPRAEVIEPLLVRQAKLQVDVDGPKLQYADTSGTYRIRIANPGTAPAKQIVVNATLPPGSKYISSTENGGVLENGNTVAWKIDNLAPAAEKVVDLKCSLSQAGENRVEITGKAEDEVSATAVARTRVETMADLVLEVIDPPGPIALGEDVVYELRIGNRGTRSAEQVEVAAFFSQGIEPTLVQGLPHRLSVGQVNFGTIPVLPPGKDVRVKVMARAQSAGSHIFRAELHCRPLGTRLVREETTHFFASDAALPSAVAAGGTPSAIGSTGSIEPLRTADRRPADAPSSVGPAKSTSDSVKERPTAAQSR